MPKSKNKFNILHIVSRLPIGGVENMILQEISGYDSNRFKARVCCMKEGGEIAKALEAAGYTVNILNKMKGHGFDLGLIKALYSIVKKGNIHILRTHQYHANLYGRITGTLAGVPVIIPTFHNVYESPDKPKLHRRLFNSLLAISSDALIGVSESVASDIKKFDIVNPQKVKVIYNGIDLRKFRIAISKAEARSLFGLPEDSIIIGTIGRLTEQKGHRYLIEAAARLQGSCLVVAGDGPLMEDLTKISNINKVNCIFTGHVSPQKVPFFLKSLDIFSFPSLWEGLPVALVEAMASGLPVVATDISPHREVLGDAGIFVPPANTPLLADVLNVLINNLSMRKSLGEKVLERATLFSIESTVKSYETLFLDILGKKGYL